MDGQDDLRYEEKCLRDAENMSASEKLVRKDVQALANNQKAIKKLAKEIENSNPSR
jgi:hypothetical protein